MENSGSTKANNQQCDKASDTVCDRCDGDGLAHGSDRPFEWKGEGTYPGKCPKCNGKGK
jgi:DnaJ-class molecular chaperone